MGRPGTLAHCAMTSARGPAGTGKNEASKMAAVAVISSLGLLAPAAHASEICYTATATVNGETLVDETACIPLP